MRMRLVFSIICSQIAPIVIKKKSKLHITLLINVNSDECEKLPSYVIGKSDNQRCFRNVKFLLKKYDASEEIMDERNIVCQVVKRFT